MNAYETNNIFAKILRGDIPCEKVFEDEHTIAFMDIMPQSDGHLLVVPKSPSIGLLDAKPEVLGPLFNAVQRLANAAKSAFKAEGVSIMQFNGSAAGQTVFHLHVHIIPRYEGLSLRAHGEEGALSHKIKENADKIREFLKNQS